MEDKHQVYGAIHTESHRSDVQSINMTQSFVLTPPGNYF